MLAAPTPWNAGGIVAQDRLEGVRKQPSLLQQKFPGKMSKLVGGWPTPSEKWWSEFVSWDDDIPNWMESHKNSCSKPPTRVNPHEIPIFLWFSHGSSHHQPAKSLGFGIPLGVAMGNWRLDATWRHGWREHLAGKSPFIEKTPKHIEKIQKPGCEYDHVLTSYFRGFCSALFGDWYKPIHGQSARYLQKITNS